MDPRAPAAVSFDALPPAGWNALFLRLLLGGPAPWGGRTKKKRGGPLGDYGPASTKSTTTTVNSLPHQSSAAAAPSTAAARSLTPPLPPADTAGPADATRRGAFAADESRFGDGVDLPAQSDQNAQATADGRAPDNLPERRPGPPALPRPEDDPAPPGRRYCLITPCRDEQQFADVTLASVAAQTEPPSLWVVVDDGSSDRTPAILDEWAEKLPYLRVIRRPDRGERRLGGGVIDAFYEGYAAIDSREFDFVCKMDLDLELPPTYFADVMDAMADDERLAVFSGKPYFRRGDKLVSEMCGDENAVGMVKFYRVGAFEQIGGFVRELMWDGIDGHRCRMLGWRAESRDDPKLRFVHLRPMGTSHKSWWTGRQRHGRGQHFMGTGPTYMTASALYRLSRPPAVIGGLAMLAGYVKSYLSGRPRYDDADFRAFLRRYQWLCLTMGKRRATAKVEAERAGAFRPPVLDRA